MFEFDESLKNLAKIAENRCLDQFLAAEQIFFENQKKVVEAFIENKVSTSHLLGSTGYGYGDIGRDIVDRVFAQIFGSADALVRHTFTCGTHAIATCLFGILRPGDHLVCATGKPYDSMESVIGLRNKGRGSLQDFGISYTQVELKDQMPDIESIRALSGRAKLVYIQKSRGYSLRSSLNLEQTAELIREIKAVNPEVIVLVDNCYSEFVERREPCELGADICVGSLIKNPGGGIARTGGYIAGSKDLVELCAEELIAPGIGKDVGCSLDFNRELLLGIFLAPQAVLNATKSAIFCGSLFDLLEFEVSPGWNEPRTDIVQSVILKTRNNLKNFCLGVQSASPVDSFVMPEEWDMPGYGEKIIMASGGFTMGATIESSADAPMKEPFVAYYQGGLTFPSGKLCVMEAADHVMKNRD